MWRLSLHKVTTFPEIAGVIAGTAGRLAIAQAFATKAVSPLGRWRSLPAHMESGQARVHSGVRPLAPLARPLRLQSRQLGSSPLSNFAAQGTSALTAAHRRDCGRRSRPQTRSNSRTTGPPSAPVCSRPAPCQRTDARTSRAKGGSGQETVPVAAGSVNRHRLLQVLSLPASQGRCNKRPGSVFPPHHRRCQESAS